MSCHFERKHACARQQEHVHGVMMDGVSKPSLWQVHPDPEDRRSEVVSQANIHAHKSGITLSQSTHPYIHAVQCACVFSRCQLK